MCGWCVRAVCGICCSCLFQAIGELEKVLEVGRMHVNVLYTFRSVSRAIPMVGGSGDPNKDALHMATFKVRLALMALRDVHRCLLHPKVSPPL